MPEDDEMVMRRVFGLRDIREVLGCNEWIIWERKVYFIQPIPCASLFVDPPPPYPARWGNAKKFHSLYYYHFASPFLLLFAEFVHVGCGREYLGLSSLPKEDPQNMCKPIFNNS